MAETVLNIRAQIKELQTGLKTTQAQLKDLQKSSDKTSQTMQSNMTRTGKLADGLATKIGAILTIGAAIKFTQAVISIRQEFEKYNAVLTTSLGSAKAANREFDKIKAFASETPFSVRELTDSFVRLVNQGFKPTTKQMQLLGDLAASTGKGFIQLTEAIIDAQVGEFERLKEFGIRANKEGDKVTFTFKGLETQVDFTADAIQGYILSLGELEGVTGSMIAISETLGGQISNLGDAWDNFLDNIGERSSGAFRFVISSLTGILNMLSDYNDLQEGITQNSKEFIATFVEALENLSPEEKIASATEEMRHFNELYQQSLENAGNREDFTRKERQSFEGLAVTYNAIRKALSEYIAEQQELLDDEVEEKQVESIELLEKRLKGLNDEKKALSITDEKRIAEINRETEAIKKQIEELNKLGVALEIKESSDETKQKELYAIERQLAEDQANFMLEIEKEMAKETEDIDKQITKKRVDEINKTLQIQLDAEQAKIDAANYGFDILSTLTKENAELNQIINIAQAIMNGALGITKTAAELGYPAAIPFQIALGLQTLAQIATIRSQKFAGGHYEVLKGRRHAQGGVNIGIGEAEQGEGVAIFSRQATQKYGKFLPAFVKAMNDNKASVTGYDDNAYNFHFDDSRQVGKLEDIRKLLAQPNVRYEKGYKIIERNGHIQRVRC